MTGGHLTNGNAKTNGFVESARGGDDRTEPPAASLRGVDVLWLLVSLDCETNKSAQAHLMICFLTLARSCCSKLQSCLHIDLCLRSRARR